MRRGAAALRGQVARLVGLFGHAAGLVLLARVLQNLNGFLLSVLIVRRFGLEGAGTLAIATVAIVALALLGTFGLPYTLARLEIDARQRNTLGLFTCVAMVPLSLPLVGVLGLMAGRSPKEALVIALLALGGPFFAQTNITNALQVLQNKAGNGVIPPTGNLVGLLIAQHYGADFATFAAILALSRFLSIGIVFLLLPCGRIGLRTMIRLLADGSRYLTADAISLGSDQAAVLVMSFLLSREALGLLGLCRQMLTVSDTPGWSQLQAMYPDVVADPDRSIPLLIRRLCWTGLTCAVAVAILTIPLGRWIYRVDGFAVLAPLMLISTPIRALLMAYDTRLRALGLVRKSNFVCAVRGAMTLIIIPGGAYVAGVMGAVFATIIHTTLATLLTRRVSVNDLERTSIVAATANTSLHFGSAYLSALPDSPQGEAMTDCARLSSAENGWRVAQPRLSIVIPAYNVAPFIEAAVTSALDQTFRDLEVVVVDDGSTDETPAALASLAERRRDSRLRIVRQVNGGLSNARNRGIRESRSAFVGFLDGDDIWMPNKAERHIAFMEADSTIGISFSYSAYLTEDGRRTGAILLAGKSKPTLHDMIRRNHVGNGSAPVVRRACFAAAGLFQEDLLSCEDYEMWCRILWSQYRAALLPEVLTLYRLRDSSLSFNFKKFLANADRAMDYIKRTMPNVPAHVLRSGHAEHYRIAAWKAATCGQSSAGRRILLQAFRQQPWLAITDWRAIGTATALLLPMSARRRFASLGKSIQQKRALRSVQLRNTAGIG
jgi:glycosyltransferase involved in cell wall biosynthesis/O-antigen/teichoic acid export membrane protein